MMHRFADKEVGVPGHDPEMLRNSLEYLRGEGVGIVPLHEILRTARAGGDISGQVAFTVDDGYADFYRIAEPIFQAFDSPVTVFLTTGFLDGQQWMWWDRVRFVLQHTEKSGVRLDLEDTAVELSWKREGEGEAAAATLSEVLREMNTSQRKEAIITLEDALEVTPPDHPPQEYSPLRWTEVRDLGKRGVFFGPHTVTHPNLATLPRDEALAEVRESWNRLRAESDTAVPLFCFPYGKPWNLTPEVLCLPQEAGMDGAVVAREQYLSARDASDHPFELPRFGWPNTLPEVRHITSGMSRAKDLLLFRG
ncbi:MAG: polysaccharide deacetylase family protein [Gemmatimonadota bacterium]